MNFFFTKQPINKALSKYIASSVGKKPVKRRWSLSNSRILQKSIDQLKMIKFSSCNYEVISLYTKTIKSSLQKVSRKSHLRNCLTSASIANFTSKSTVVPYGKSSIFIHTKTFTCKLEKGFVTLQNFTAIDLP